MPRPSYDANGNEIPVTPRRPMPRQMRAPEARAVDPQPSVRRQAREEMSLRPSFDRDGRPIAPSVPTPTAPSRTVPARQENVAPPRPGTGNPLRDAATFVGNWVSGNVPRQREAGEIAWQSVPEQDDVRWEGGPLSGVLNALPQGARSWLDAQGRANAIGVGFFLDPNESHRAEIIRRQVPTSQFRRDEYGNVQVRFDAEQPWAYMNQPGASTEDAVTLAGEIEKYLVTRRMLPGGGRAAPGARSPLLTSTIREGVAGGASMAGGQTAAMAVGGPGPDPVDVTIAAAGGAGGNVVGHSIASTVRGVPRVARQVGEWASDRFPGGAQRAAERGAAAEVTQASRMQAAREQAAETVRAMAQQIGLTGERLQTAVAAAENDAAERITAELIPSGPGPAARDVERMARELGINLSRSQSEFNPAGVRFLYDAAQGHYGSAAAKAASDFLEMQSAQIPAALRSVAGDASIPNPQAGVAAARTGMESMRRAGQEAEDVAWDRFNTHADRYIRTFDVTPAGNPSGVSRVLDNLNAELQRGKPRVFMHLPEYAAQYPQVASAMSLAQRMNGATRADLPIHDVDRIIELKRFIDSAWESAATPTERRILSRMGGVVRGWLRDAAGYNEGVPAALRTRATQTAGHLRGALEVSAQNAGRYRDNAIIADMLEQTRPNAVGAPEGALAMTDQEVTRRLFGGGESTLSVSGDALQALRVMKDVLGASSPEWQALRQSALQRLTANLDNALATRQAMPIITAINNSRRAFAQNREALHVLFSPEELARMNQWQEALRAVAPPARNPVNSSGTTDTLLRVGRGLMQSIMSGAKGVPFGVGETARAAENSIAGARVAAEISGAASPGANIARAFADLWQVERNIGGAGGAIGAAYETTQSIPERAVHSGDPFTAPILDRGLAASEYDTTRAALENTDGSYSTERTITIEADGQFYIIPSIVNGRALSADEAIAAWERGENPEVHTPFSTMGEAEAYAQWRSAQIPAARQAVGAQRY